MGDLGRKLEAKKEGSNSQYATFETKNGEIITIRLADHNATVSNFDNYDEYEGISIVVTPKKNKGITNDGDAHIVEYFYDAIKLRKAEGKPLAEIVRSIQQSLYSGEYKDTTGLAERQEVNGEGVMKGQPMFQMKGEVMMREGERREERREVSRKAWEEMAFRRERLNRQIEDVNKRIVDLTWGSDEWNRLFDERAKLIEERKAVVQELASVTQRQTAAERQQSEAFAQRQWRRAHERGEEREGAGRPCIIVWGKFLLGKWHLDDDDPDVLVIQFRGHFCYVPVAWEENEKLVGCAIIKPCFFHVVVIVYDIGLVFAIRFAGVVVDDAKSLGTLHHILEIDVVMVALAIPFFERSVAPDFGNCSNFLTFLKYPY